MKNLNHVLFGTLAVLAVLFLTGCWEKDNPVRTSLNVDTSTLTLAVGESATRTATTKAQWDYQITYSSSNPAVATVDQTGKVTGVSEGEAVITVSMAETIKSWYAAATLSYNVVVKKLIITGIDGINAANVYTGHLTATAGFPVTWSSNHPEILSVDANGNVMLAAYPASATDVTIAVNLKSDPSVSDSKVISVVDPGLAMSSSTVGMIIAANGKVYTPGNYHISCGKKVAIVAYKGSAGSADKSTITDASGYVGLAIALNDADANKLKWRADGVFCNCIPNGMTPYLIIARGSDTSYDFDNSGFGKGIDNTNRLATDACGDGHDHAAAKAAVNYKNTVAPPTGTSQWFLPTMYQWQLMVKAMCGDYGDVKQWVNNSNYEAAKFNEKIIAAGGTGVHAGSYWSSVEFSTAQAWGMLFDAGGGWDGETYNGRYVRAVLAF